MNTRKESNLNLSMSKLFYHLDVVQKWVKGEYFVPIEIEINPTDQCNQRCPFCYTQYLGHQPLSIPGDMLFKIFKDLPKAGVKACHIQGTGEPFLNKDLPEAILIGKQEGLDLAVSTNGSCLTDEVLKQVVPNLCFLRITNLEHNAELYAKTHGCPESHFYKATSALKNAVKLRDQLKADVVVGTQIIPFYYNIPFIKKTVLMLKNYGVDYVHIKPAGQFEQNQEHRWERDIHLIYEEQLLAVQELSDDNFLVNINWGYLKSQETKGHFVKDYQKCYGVEFKLLIDANCKIYPCFMHWRNDRYCIGDLSQNTFEEIWKSERKDRILKDFYNSADLSKCLVQCFQHKLNTPLWALKHPPTFPNFL